MKKEEVYREMQKFIAGEPSIFIGEPTELSMPRPDSVFVALVNSSNEILTTRRSSSIQNGGMWALPGGRQDPGETFMKTGCREVFEEIGLLIADMAENHGHVHVRSGRDHVIVIPWTPTKANNECLTRLLNGSMVSTEVDAVKWRTWSEITSMTGLHKSLELFAIKLPMHSFNLFDLLESRPVL